LIDSEGSALPKSMTTCRNAMFRSLITGFARTVDRFPERPALVVDGKSFSYVQLLNLATRISHTIQQYQQSQEPLAAVFAARSVTAYAAILGIHAAGKGYVPLNPKFPVERTKTMLLLSGANLVIADSKGTKQLAAVLKAFPRSLTVIMPDTTDASPLSSECPNHRFVPSGGLGNAGTFELAPDVACSSLAYLLFTSGSTGEPKGVAISRSSVRSYIDYITGQFDINEEDRISQEFELTFDLSVHDMFVAWECGACVFCVPDGYTMLPAKFIRDNRLTVWFSVPSVIGNLARFKLLPENCFPSLRYSLFCGEPLPATYASLWRQASPNSVIENLYGPTEATIAITHYRWDQATSPEECYNGIVPIGWVFKEQRCRVVGPAGNIVPPGEPGELFLSGSQVASGYWNDDERTREKFGRFPADGDQIWYRTGDLVKQTATDCLFYLGRMDNQVKVRGYRMDLQEIDSVLRRVSGAEQVVSLPWPVRDSLASGVVAFVCGTKSFDERFLINACREFLPEYMVPRRVRLLDEMPLNENGKTDRRKLIELLEGECS
jgi:amino acid adenylation domain-containing protein